MKLTKTYELERHDHNGHAYHQYELELEAHYTRGYPGNYNNPPEPPELEITKSTCGGEAFELTDEEYEKIVDAWLEDPDFDPDDVEDVGDR